MAGTTRAPSGRVDHKTTLRMLSRFEMSDTTPVAYGEVDTLEDPGELTSEAMEQNDGLAIGTSPKCAAFADTEQIPLRQSTNGGLSSTGVREGATVSARFHILERLGRGGMGVVFAAYDRELGGEVALKFLYPKLALDPTFIDRLVEEVRVGRRISHRNVCRLYDLGRTAKGALFVSMERVRGRTLEEIAKRRPIPLAQAMSWMVEILDALSAAHDQGIVHRDLKPGNIMVTEDGDIKVLDFGLAVEASSRGGVAAGSPYYWAPEQARGAPVTPAADIYSFGVLASELLGGHPLPKAVSGLPCGMRKFLAGCLARNPADRYCNAMEAQRELAKVCKARIRRWLPRIAAAAALLAIGVGGGLALAEHSYPVHRASIVAAVATDRDTLSTQVAAVALEPPRVERERRRRSSERSSVGEARITPASKSSDDDHVAVPVFGPEPRQSAEHDAVVLPVDADPADVPDSDGNDRPALPSVDERGELTNIGIPLADSGSLIN